MASRPSAGRRRLAAGVQEDEAAGAVGVLGAAGRVAGLAEERRLLVAGDPRDRHLAAELARRPVDVGRGQRLGQARRVDAEQLAELRVPGEPADVEEHRARGVRVVGRVAAGQLEQQPGVDRAEDGARRQVGVAQQPLDLGAGEVGVEDEPGALADQRLVPGLAQLVAARRGAAVLPDQRPVQRLARCRVPGDDRLALVGDPDRVELGALDAGVGERLARDPPRHLPDLARVVLDPARPREVLLELRVGAPGDPPLRVEDEAGGPGGPLVDREDHPLARKVDAGEVGELAGAVGEAGERAAAGAVGEVELVLAQAVAGAHRVDRHPDLHPVAAGEGQGRAQRVDPQRPLAGDRRLGHEAAAAADRPAGEAERQAEAAADAAAEGGDREVALAALDRRDQRRQRGRRAAEVAVAEQHDRGRRLGAQRRLRRGGHVCALAMRPSPADHLGARRHRDLGGAVGGGVVGDPQRRPGEGAPQRRHGLPHPVRLVARGDDRGEAAHADRSPPQSEQIGAATTRSESSNGAGPV